MGLSTALYRRNLLSINNVDLRVKQLTRVICLELDDCIAVGWNGDGIFKNGRGGCFPYSGLRVPKDVLCCLTLGVLSHLHDVKRISV